MCNMRNIFTSFVKILLYIGLIERIKINNIQCLLAEQLHQDVQVFGSDVPTIEFVRAISATR